MTIMQDLPAPLMMTLHTTGLSKDYNPTTSLYFCTRTTTLDQVNTKERGTLSDYELVLHGMKRCRREQHFRTIMYSSSSFLCFRTIP